MKEELKHIQKDKEELCHQRLKYASRNKTEPWTMKQLGTVLKHLKKNKSRDPFGYANEIFRSKVAGDDLKKAILYLMNGVKKEQVYPEVLEVCNISSIYKMKGSRNDFNSYRGIFGIPIFRSILDRLIYNDEYDIIDDNLSDSNVGARKNQNIRYYIFVVNAVTYSVVNGKEDAVDIHIFDVEKCFDDKLPLLFLENQNAQVAVKTPTGIS